MHHGVNPLAEGVEGDAAKVGIVVGPANCETQGLPDGPIDGVKRSYVAGVDDADAAFPVVVGDGQFAYCLFDCTQSRIGGLVVGS